MKSGILITSSIAAYINAGSGNIYSGSKIFCNYLALAVRKELEAINSRVEITILNPGMVYSNMTAKMKKTCSCFWTSAEDCVYKTLKDIGKEKETNGVFKHEVLDFLGRAAWHWASLGVKT